MNPEIHNSLLEHVISDTYKVSSANFELLFSVSKCHYYKKGENVLSEGQASKEIYFVEKGYLRIFYNKDGIEKNTAFAFEGDFITNLKSIRFSLPSESFIQAAEDVVLYSFNKDRLLELYKKSPEIESFGRLVLENLLIAGEEHSALFKIYSPSERYTYLVENCPQIIQRVSLTNIASFIGITRETLSRIRARKNLNS